MGFPWTRRLLATIAVTGGITGATQLPALAAHAVTPTVSINVKTAVKVSGLNIVFYRSGAATGKISGSVSAAVSGEVVRLYARRFPYTKPFAPVGAPVTLGSTGTAGYAFPNVTPTLATRYKVKLFSNSAATTPLASSTVKIIYVSEFTPTRETHTCPRPNCTSVAHVRVFLPASAMRTERAKKVYPYFAVNLSPTQIPPSPTRLRLGAGHPRVSSTRKIAADEYAFRITFTFRIGNNAASWRFNFCTKDTLTKDGLGLPGHHSCGATTIPARIIYLG